MQVQRITLGAGVRSYAVGEGDGYTSGKTWYMICTDHASTGQCVDYTQKGGEIRELVLSGTNSVTSGTDWC